MTERNLDRRGSQRVTASLNLQVALPREDGTVDTARLETLNISSSGVYFRSQRFVEPMTKLAMDLELPVAAGQGRVRTARVQCEGIVVRVQPERPVPGCEDYEVAVFFTHIEPDGLRRLEEHIALVLESV